MRENFCKAFLLYTASAFAALAVLCFAFHSCLPWLLPFLLAFAAAHALQNTMHFLQRKLHFSCWISALLCTLFVLFLCGGIALYFFTALLGEANRFFAALPHLSDMSETLHRLFPFLPSFLLEWISEQITQGIGLLDGVGKATLAAVSAFLSSLPQLFLFCTTTVLALFFTLNSYDILKKALRSHLPEHLANIALLLRQSVFLSFGHWLRCECILCFFTFVQLLSAFWLLRLPYPLLYAFLITILDALPVFGTGTVLIPWAILDLFAGYSFRALILIVLFLSTTLVRSYMQPHLMSEQSALPPLASLFAMYLGFCTCGIGGMVFFPVLLLLIEQIYYAIRQKQQMSK